ncbi:hypothetical protein, partial [Escherichia coli]|uniref:hypothetical protein n=1 Tax=Escherichia coli TaxID=562 RepID=UPI0015F318CA
MSGKPAARQGDMTQYGGSIVQGSAGVRIGAPTGVACSVCPGGVTQYGGSIVQGSAGVRMSLGPGWKMPAVFFLVTSGHPVNPLLGAKVLPG